jgi:hypothetical protein
MLDIKLASLLFGVYGGNHTEEVENAAGVTPLVVVPGNELDEVLVE